jgi:hypothetical protein
MKPKKKLVLESAFPGSNLNLVQARVSKDLYEAIETESKKRERSIPELVRDFVSFHLIPGTLKKKISEGKELDSKDRELLEAYRDYLSELAEACTSIDESQRKIEFKKVKRHLRGIDALLDKKVEEAVSRVIDRMQKEKKGGKFK